MQTQRRSGDTRTDPYAGTERRGRKSCDDAGGRQRTDPLYHRHGYGRHRETNVQVQQRSGQAGKMAATQSENQQKEPKQALALPGGKALSMFDPPALPAAFTEFLFGDCVPFLKRDTPVTYQQIFHALRSREELEYHLADDAEPYM